MSLKIYLLGQFKLLANDQPIELPSRPAQSLLAYLALNAGTVHRREKLAGLLWPEAVETNARSYLRQALWRIRRSLESGGIAWEKYLQVGDISVCFDAQSDCWMDAPQLLEKPGELPMEEIIAIVQLYRGELLPGFYDEWVVLERDRLAAAYYQKMNTLLERLIQSGEWADVLKWSEHWIQAGYAPEPAFRGLMLAHAGLGDLGMVSLAYQRCVEGLNRELGLEPSPETRQLYELILSGEISTSGFRLDSSTKHPQRFFLDEKDESHLPEETIFVAREQELAQLDGFMDQALKQHGKVVFVTGEAGSGKTALLQEFIRRARKAYPGLIAASGFCNAYTGIGDPYLPFREILELLTGDVEARWAAGALAKEHARTLWNMLPLAAQALVDAGPDLVGTFIHRDGLLERAKVYAPGGSDWLTRLEHLVSHRPLDAGTTSSQQNALFEQYTRVVQLLAQQHPLLLVLDDLQWADLGSISLLFHIGRHLPGNRILIVGAYRIEEVISGKADSRHPLEPVINELQRIFGDNTVSLGQTEGKDFVTAVLDSEPNLLEAPFRDMLYRQTHGHPLFTIELLRGMQERGDLVKDGEGHWIEGSVLDWETLPARVEAVIAERIGRLDRELQDVLRVASVAGESFTGEVVARVISANEREILRCLSDELDRKHRLVRAQSILRADGQLLSRYRFRHILFQKYLYGGLDEVERVHLHEQVGTVIEGLYKVETEAAPVSVELARHFQEAQIKEKAIFYLHQAGNKALQLSAYQEAITHLTRGLDLLMTLPDTPERAEQELNLQLSLAIAWIGEIPGPDYKKTISRALELAQQIGETTQVCRILGELSIYHYVRAEYHKAREFAEKSLSLAPQTGDPMYEVLGHWHLGFIHFGLGEFRKARFHLQQVIAFYEPEKHYQEFVALRGSDPGLSALAYDAVCLWCLGYPDQALRRSQDALGMARELGHPFTLADVLRFGVCMFNEMRRDAEAIKIGAEELIQVSKENGFSSFLPHGIWTLGKALIMLGEVQEGIAKMREGLLACELLHARCSSMDGFLSLAGAYAQIGQVEKGLDTLREASALIEETGERCWEAEMHRLRGDLLLMQGKECEGEASFEKSIEVAREQHAKIWELRGSTSLARLWQKQGKVNEAYQMLEEIINWFTEGYDIQEFREAQALLEDLSAGEKIG